MRVNWSIYMPRQRNELHRYCVQIFRVGKHNCCPACTALLSDSSAGKFSESWSWLPTVADTVGGIIISVFHRMCARVSSPPAPCQLLSSLSLVKPSSSIHVTAGCSWADLVSVCRDCRVSRWGRDEPPSKASRNKGGVWARVLWRGGVGLVGL